jgi:hypothetical protein
MTTYILVFWLATPSNFAEHNRYQSETECRQAAIVWNQRLQQVKSKMIAECRL